MDPLILIAPIVALLLHRFVPLHHQWDWIAGAGAILLTLAVMPHVVSSDNDLSIAERLGLVAGAASLPFVQFWGLVGVIRLMLSRTESDTLTSARETEARWFRRNS